MTVATEVMEVDHEGIDPKQVIWDAMKGQIDRIQPTSGDVIICVYERPKKTRGNLIIPDTASRVSEDKFQGVVGLIVKTGPDYGKHQRALGLDKMPAVGDWVAFNNRDCIAFTLGKRAMRLLEGHFIRMLLSDPDAII